MVKKLCPYCRRLIDITKPCSKCSKSFSKTDRNNTFYQTYTWRKKRNEYIKHNPLCVHCKEKGIITKANVVDHITRIKDGGSKLDDNNLQSLCTKCHNSKSGKERHHSHHTQ